MSDAYPIPIQTIVKTVDELLRHQGEEQIADLLSQAEGSIDWTTSDNWNGGIDYYTMNLHVPVLAYATIEPRREEIEEIIKHKVQVVSQKYEQSVISTIKIIPDLLLHGVPSKNLLPPSIIQRVWGERGLRLFLTHRAEDKVFAANLKEELGIFGVSTFVAHEDIEPNQEWQSEIERALSSMQALATILTPGFDKSIWCQQEIGSALGCGIPIFPIRLGADPPGFISKIQALSGNKEDVPELVNNLIDLFIKNSRLSLHIKESLIKGLEIAPNFNISMMLCARIVTITDFDKNQLERLERSIAYNDQVAKAYGVADAIKKIIARHRV